MVCDRSDPALVDRVEAHAVRIAASDDVALLIRPERRVQMAADLYALLARVRELEAEQDKFRLLLECLADDPPPNEAQRLRNIALAALSAEGQK